MLAAQLESAVATPQPTLGKACTFTLAAMLCAILGEPCSKAGQVYSISYTDVTRGPGSRFSDTWELTPT